MASPNWSLFGKLRVFWSGPSASCPGREAKIQSHPSVESVFLPQLTRRASDSYWKLCNLVILKLREGQAESIVRRAKSVALFSQGNWGAGWLKTTKKDLDWFQSCFPHCTWTGNLITALLIAEYSLSDQGI